MSPGNRCQVLTLDITPHRDRCYMQNYLDVMSNVKT